MQRLDAHEVARDGVELAPRLELWPRRRVALGLREGMKGAPLDPGARPGLARGLGEWSDRRSRGNKRPSWAPLTKGYLTVPEKVIYQRER